MQDVIICANFGVEKLRGLGNTRGQILESFIEMAGHPYNSAALPRSMWRSYEHGVCPMHFDSVYSRPYMFV